jgi:cell division transport system permease protein
VVSAPVIEPRKPAGLLPNEDERETALVFVVAVLCFLACLSVLTAIAANRAAEGWARDLRGEATIQVRPGPGETGATAAALAAETLAGADGVIEAAALERERAEELLRPWLGEAVLEDLPIPHLVTVRLDPKRPATAAELKRALTAAGLDADVDDHGRWLKDVERTAASARLAGAAISLLLAGAAAAALAFATRAGLTSRREAVEVLHVSGATDAFIAGLFQWRYGKLAALAGFYGALGAAFIVAAVKLIGGGEGFGPALPVAWTDILALSPCPLLAATLGALSARVSALRLLASEAPA